MIEVRDGFEFEGIYTYPAPEDRGTWLVAPLAAAPERASDGKPTAMLIRTGATGFLQLGLALHVPDAVVERLRRQLAARAEVPAHAIRISPAPMEVREVVLAFGDGRGAFADAMRKPSSGFPPYSAVFHLPLDAAQVGAAAAALDGREGFARIRYDAVIGLTASATAVVSGDVTRALETMPETGDAARLRSCAERVLREAIEDGRVRVAVQADATAPPSLRSRAQALATEQALEALVRARSGGGRLPDAAHAEFAATLRERVDVPNGIETDVGSWFEGR